MEEKWITQSKALDAWIAPRLTALSESICGVKFGSADSAVCFYDYDNSYKTLSLSVRWPDGDMYAKKYEWPFHNVLAELDFTQRAKEWREASLADKWV